MARRSINLTNEQIREVYESNSTYAELAEQYQVSPSTIRNIVKANPPYEWLLQPHVIKLELTRPSLQEHELVEGYGAIDLEDIDLNPGEPEDLTQPELKLLDELVDSSGPLAWHSSNSNIGEKLTDYGYARRREDPKGHKWLMTDEGKLRHALEYYRREHGLVEPEFVAEDVEETTRVGEVSMTKVRRAKVTQSNHIFSPEFEQRLGDQLDRIVDHICGKK